MKQFWNFESTEDAFPEPPELPERSKDACFDPKVIRSFLSASRSSTDEVLKQRLNSLLNDPTHSKEQVCDQFATDVIFQAWRDRTSLISYCDGVATELKNQIDKEPESQTQPVIDARIDPYAARDVEASKESKYLKLQSLQEWIQNEKKIEVVVQTRSSQLLNDSCGVVFQCKEKFDRWSSSQRK